jgi:hypothetical protein
MHLAAKV